jgi:autotransporter-associated beta strand protein
MNPRLLLFTVIATLVSMTAARATGITWSAAAAISGTADISHLGTFVDATQGYWGYSTQTFGDAVFAPSGISNGSVVSAGGHISFNLNGGTAQAGIQVVIPGGDANYNTLLNQCVYSNGTTTLMLGGLNAHTTYQLQIWTSQGSGYDTTFSLGGNAVTLNSGFNWTTPPQVGQFVTGTFTTGTETSETFTVTGDGAQTYFTAAQLRIFSRWINAAGGSWTAGANWAGGFVPNGVGAIADFSTLDLTADSTVTLDGNVTVGSLLFGDTAPGNNRTLNSGSGGVLTLGVSTGSPGITVTSGTATINAALAGVQGLAKNGDGTLILAGSNSYTGATTINSGTLLAGVATSAFGVNSAVTLANTAGTTLDLNNYSNTIGSLCGGGTAGGLVALENAALTVGGDNTSSTYSGSISDNNYGAVSIIKVGTGRLTLTGTCSMHGAVSISGGVLELAYRSSLYPTGWGGAIINTGGTLLLHDWGYGSQDGFGGLGGPGNPITINGGTIEQAGGGISWIWGLVSGQRWFAIGDGGATLQSDAGILWEIGNGWNFILTNNSSLTLTGSGNGQIDAPVTGTGTLTMNGSGTWTLTGSNNYTGTTVVNSGTLCLTSGSHGAATVALGAALSVVGPVAMAQVPVVATGGILNFGMGGVGASGAIQITGSYTAPSSPIDITITDMNCVLGGGTYNLITGATGISADSFVLNSVLTGYTCALSASNGTLALSVVASPSSPTAALGVSGTAGSAFSYQIALVSNPTGFGATGLPPGLSLNPGTGLISGTTTDAGTYFATISSTGAAGTATSQLIFVVPQPVGTPALSTSVPRGYFNNVAESGSYTLVYSLNTPSLCNYASTAPAYSVDTHAAVGSFSRVAYYMELQAPNGTLQYIWASMNPFTADAAQIGVPTVASGANFQQAVTGLNVVSNVAGVTTGTGLSGTVNFTPLNSGSMTFANGGGTLFGFTNWSGGSGCTNVGIGGVLASGTGYLVKSLQVLVLNSGTTLTVQPAPDSSLLINPGKGFAEYLGPSAYTDKWVGIGYSRSYWMYMEPSEGVCDWTWSDTLIANYAAHGLPFGFGIISTDEISMYVTPSWVFASGTNPVTGKVYPKGADPLTVTCPNGVQTVIPSSWDDPVYLARMKEFIAAFGAKYNGNPNIAFIQMLNYGLWGEGNGCFSPGLAQVSPGTLMNDYCMPYLQAFPNTQLMEDVIYPSVASSLVASGCGDFGCGIMSGITNGAPLLIAYPNHPTQMEYGPLISPYRGGQENELLLWVTSGRTTYLVFDPNLADSDPNFYQMVGNLIGYHFTLEQATVPKTITANVAFPLSFTWYNDGVAPLTLSGTAPCNVSVALLDANNNLVQKQWLPTSNPKGWMPGVPVTENFSNVSFSSVPAGYKLAVGLFLNQTDANPTYRLANQGRTVTGWYIISGSTTQPAATWTSATGGSWQTGGNWTGSGYTNGIDATVDFSTLNLTGNATVTLDGNVTAGTLLFGDTAPSHNWTLASGTGGALTLWTKNGMTSITVNNQTTTISAPVVNYVGFSKNGSGTLALTNTNTFNGNININGGVLDLTQGMLFGGNFSSGATITVGSGATLQLAGNGAFGWGGNPGIGNSDIGAQSVAINGGTINFTGTTLTGGGRDFTIGALGATFQSSQSGGVLTISSGYTGIVTDNSSLTLAGNGTGGGVFQSNITGTGSLIKTGNGTWLLTGSNNYTGPTSVNAGILGMSQSNSTPFLAVASGAALAMGGASGSPGPLILSGTLALGGGSNLNFVLGSSASDSIQITGAYSAPGGTVSINLSSNQGGLVAGTYNLITGAWGAGAGSFAVGSAPSGYGYALSASNGTLSLTVTAPASQPTGLTATGANGSVSLGWAAATGAVSYNIKRSPTSGSGYVTIASGVTATTYTDYSVSNGTTYYYVVSSVNGAGESTNSTQAGAMPVNQVALPSPWTKVDVGSVGTTGTSYYDGGSTFVVKGAGRGLRTTADSLQFAYVTTTLTSFSVVARVTTAPTGSSQVGVMIRSGTTAGSTMVAVMLDPNAGSYRARLGYRTTSGGSMAWAPAASTGLAIPQWLKLTRAGNLYTGQVSSDGQTWTTVSSTTSAIIGSGSTAYAGLAVSSLSTSSLATETFDNVSLPAWTAPPGAPSGLTAVAATQSQVNLSWSAVSGATGYQVLRSSSWGGTYSQSGTSATTSYSDTGLSAGAEWYYMVRATSSSGTSGNSTVATATTLAAAPASLTATAGNGQVALSWSASGGATGYNVKRSTVSGSNYVTIVNNTAATSYTDTGVTNWIPYYYVVSALNAGGEGANSAQAAAQPQSPPISVVEKNASSSISLSGSNTSLTFKSSVAGHTYQLQTIDSLTSGTWTNYGSPQPGTGGNLIFQAPYDNTVPRRFYRLQIQQ